MSGRTRIPQEPRQKARFFLSKAEEELAVQRLQSAENFLRLAAVHDPEDKGIHALLDHVIQRRRTPSG